MLRPRLAKLAIFISSCLVPSEPVSGSFSSSDKSPTMLFFVSVSSARVVFFHFVARAPVGDLTRRSLDMAGPSSSSLSLFPLFSSIIALFVRLPMIKAMADTMTMITMMNMLMTKMTMAMVVVVVMTMAMMLVISAMVTMTMGVMMMAML